MKIKKMKEETIASTLKPESGYNRQKALFTKSVEYDEAKEHCRSLGGDLVIIGSQEENDGVVGKIQTCDTSSSPSCRQSCYWLNLVWKSSSWLVNNTTPLLKSDYQVWANQSVPIADGVHACITPKNGYKWQSQYTIGCMAVCEAWKDGTAT